MDTRDLETLGEVWEYMMDSGEINRDTGEREERQR